MTAMVSFSAMILMWHAFNEAPVSGDAGETQDYYLAHKEHGWAASVYAAPKDGVIEMAEKIKLIMAKKLADEVEIEIIGDGEDIYIVADGVKIAKRGHPGTLQAKTWITLEPGWNVSGGRSDDEPLEIEYSGEGRQVH